MNYNIESLATAPSLLLIFVTAIFGLNDVGIRPIRELIKGNGIFEMMLGFSFLALAWGSFMMISAVAFGASIYTWRGCLLMWGIAGVFTFAGKFTPWRMWIRRLANIEKLERQWGNAKDIDMHELAGLIEDGRRAVSIAYKDKGGECVRVLPKIVVALEKVTVKQFRINNIRQELAQALDALKSSIGNKENDIAPLLEKVKSILDNVEGALNDS